MSWKTILKGVLCVGVLVAVNSAVYSQSQRDPFRDQGFDRGRSGNPEQSNKTSQDQAYQNLTPRQRYCFALENKMAQNWIAKANTRKNLPELNQELREWDKKFLQAQRRTEKAKCYVERFLFGKELKNTRKCRRLAKKVEEARNKLQELQEKKSRATSRDTREEDNLISQLASAGCGEQYEKEDRKRNRFTFLFSDDEDDRRRNNQNSGTNILPFATYRTMCVRTCDGFYYPVSFSTLQSRFPIDQQKCQSQCAAPAELFVYKNPGEQIEQMVSLEGVPYSEMSYAFRYRKEYIEGCSCKQEEFSPEKLGLNVDKDEKQNATNSQSQQEKNTSQKSEKQRKKIEYID